VLSVGWLIGAVVLTVLLTAWVIFTLTRLDRLHARVDAAQAALDAQLVRRAAALQHVVEVGAASLQRTEAYRYDQVATDALATVGFDRETAENEVGHAIGLAERHPDTRDPRPVSCTRHACG
jgi:hypothetical protein